MLFGFIAACVALSFGAMILTDKLCAKYSKYRNGLKVTGQNLVQMFLNEKGLEALEVTSNGGDDYYNVEDKTINLSAMTYDKDTVTAMAISAHECGHVLQTKKGSVLVKIKKNFTIFINAGIYIGAVLLSIGYIMGASTLVNVALALLLIALGFQFITLPLEIDASLKALAFLKSKNIDKEELRAVKILLFVAAISYFGNLFYNVANMFKTTWFSKKRVANFEAI